MGWQSAETAPPEVKREETGFAETNRVATYRTKNINTQKNGLVAVGKPNRKHK